MTNYEIYKEEIRQLSLNGSRFCNDFVIPKMLGPMGRDCNGTFCSVCNMRFSAWLMEEYKEPDVDWSKVPVDTKIYISASRGKNWVPRYFAKYENGKVYAWNNGATSWTTDDMYGWDYAKLTEDEAYNESRG